MKTVLETHQFLFAEDMSSDFLSDVITFQYMDNAGVQLNFTGSAVGTFDVLGSIDGVYFIPLILSAVPVASGVDGQVLINMQGLAFNKFKIGYTSTSGTGVCDGFVTIKAI